MNTEFIALTKQFDIIVALYITHDLPLNFYIITVTTLCFAIKITTDLKRVSNGKKYFDVKMQLRYCNTTKEFAICFLYY